MRFRLRHMLRCGGAAIAALRLIFAYEGRRIDLVGAEHVDAIAPTPPVSRRGAEGFRLELRGHSEEPLFVRVLGDPFGESVEFATGEPGEPIRRAEVENPSGTFTVMVPALDEGVEVALFEGPRETGRDRYGHEDARQSQDPIARFELPRSQSGT